MKECRAEAEDEQEDEAEGAQVEDAEWHEGVEESRGECQEGREGAGS